MCIQPAPEDAECLCDAVTLDGKLFQTWSSDEEGPVTSRRTTRWRHHESRR